MISRAYNLGFFFFKEMNLGPVAWENWGKTGGVIHQFQPREAVNHIG